MAWCLLSGGKDSICTAHVLALNGQLNGCLHIDTGIGTPDLQPFLTDLCEKQGWPLEIIATPIKYEDLVLKFGFPVPGTHNLTMNYLKLRALRGFGKIHGKVALASGVRRLESARRRWNTQALSTVEGFQIAAPLLAWPTQKVWDYLKKYDLSISPAYAKLHISGDCLCGAFAQPEEIYLLETFYPTVAERIQALEARMKAHPSGRRTWGDSGGAFAGQTRICEGCLPHA